MKTAKQNQKFPFHFFFRFAAEGWGEEAREKCKEIFWFLHTRVRERVRGALVRITAQSERTMQFQATTRSARAKLGILLEMGSDFFKQTPHFDSLHKKRVLLFGRVILTLPIFLDSVRRLRWPGSRPYQHCCQPKPHERGMS